MVIEVRDLWPAFPDRHPKLLGMLAASKDGISIVIEHDALFAPQHDHGNGRPKKKTGRRLEALRPILDGAQGTRPVFVLDEGAAIAATIQERRHRGAR